MSILKISNLLNKKALQDAEINFYHFGFLDELNTSPENNFNAGGINGRLYPSLDLLPPERVLFTIDEAERENYRLCLIFSDLYGSDNCGATDNRTKLEVWAALQSTAKRFIFELNEALAVRLGGGIVGEVSFEMDAGFNDKLCFIKCDFTAQINGECFDDVEAVPVPPLAEACDIENYNCCKIVGR